MRELDVQKNYKQFSNIYSLIYSVLIPLFFAFHALIWIIYQRYGIQSSLGNFLLYSWKLATFILFIVALNVDRFRVKKNVKQIFFFYATSLIIFFGLINPLIFGEFNLFYYFADAFGLVSFVYLFWFIRHAVIKSFLSLAELVNPIIKSTKRISLIIIVYSIISNFDKVSIPPEIHFGLALTIGFFFVKKSDIRVDFGTIVLLMIASILSLMRIYLVVFIVSALYSVFTYLKSSMGLKKKIRIVSLVSIVFLLSYIIAGDIVQERLNSMAFVGSSESVLESENDFFTDNSIETRFLEAKYIQQSIQQSNFFFLFFGRGFGAEYDYLFGKKHHSHIAYVSILFRNGVVGLILFLLIVLYSLKIFSKNEFSRIFGLSMLVTAFALFTDQYVYYGLHLSVCLALVSINENSISMLS
jgi:hypothetical protein